MAGPVNRSANPSHASAAAKNGNQNNGQNNNNNQNQGRSVSVSYHTILYLQVTSALCSLLITALGIWGIAATENERCFSSGGSRTCRNVLTFDPKEGACGGPNASTTDMFNCWWIFGVYSFVILLLGLLMFLSLFRIEFVQRHFFTLTTVKGNGGFLLVLMLLLWGVVGQAGIVCGAICGFIGITYLVIAAMHHFDMGHPPLLRR